MCIYVFIYGRCQNYIMKMLAAPPVAPPPQKNKNINGMQPAVKVNKPLVSGY